MMGVYFSLRIIAKARNVAQNVTCKFTHVNWSTSNAAV